jgi:hypothetical protein
MDQEYRIVLEVRRIESEEEPHEVVAAIKEWLEDRGDSTVTELREDEGLRIEWTANGNVDARVHSETALEMLDAVGIRVAQVSLVTVPA